VTAPTQFVSASADLISLQSATVAFCTGASEALLGTAPVTVPFCADASVGSSVAAEAMSA
jgi:hypothetical protein